MAVQTEAKKYRISPVEGVIAPERRDWRIADLAVVALRLALAGLFVLHGLREYFGILLPSDVRWLGTPGPMTDRWMAASLEMIGAILLASGAFTRSVSVGLAVFVVLSAFAPARTYGHWMFDGAELIALYASVLLVLALMGPGVFSVDAWRAMRRRPRSTGARVSMSPWIKRQYRHRELTR